MTVIITIAAFLCIGGSFLVIGLSPFELFFNNVKRTLCNEPVDILKALDSELVKTALEGEWFRRCFLQYAVPGELTTYVNELIEEKSE